MKEIYSQSLDDYQQVFEAVIPPLQKTSGDRLDMGKHP
jgi:hypothetical protein